MALQQNLTPYFQGRVIRVQASESSTRLYSYTLEGGGSEFVVNSLPIRYDLDAQFKSMLNDDQTKVMAGDRVRLYFRHLGFPVASSRVNVIQSRAILISRIMQSLDEGAAADERLSRLQSDVRFLLESKLQCARTRSAIMGIVEEAERDFDSASLDLIFEQVYDALGLESPLIPTKTSPSLQQFDEMLKKNGVTAGKFASLATLRRWLASTLSSVRDSNRPLSFLEVYLLRILLFDLDHRLFKDNQELLAETYDQVFQARYTRLAIRRSTLLASSALNSGREDIFFMALLVNMLTRLDKNPSIKKLFISRQREIASAFTSHFGVAQIRPFANLYLIAVRATCPKDSSQPTSFKEFEALEELNLALNVSPKAFCTFLTDPKSDTNS